MGWGCIMPLLLLFVWLDTPNFDNKGYSESLSKSKV